MKCDKCDTEVPEGAAFCPQCGQALSAAAGDRPSSQQPEKTPAPAQRVRAAADAGQTSPEQMIWQTRYSTKAMAGTWFLAALVTLLLPIGTASVAWLRQSSVAWSVVGLLILVVWVVSLVRLAMNRLGIKYTLTNKRFIHESGILVHKIDRIEVIDIDDVTYAQGIVERMFNVGSITIVSSDRTHPELTLRGIDDVKAKADKLDEVRREERERRGLFVETI